MHVRIHRYIVDLAGSGLVLLGFLLAAMAVSAVPVVVQGLTHHAPLPAQPAAAAAPDLSGNRATS